MKSAILWAALSTVLATPLAAQNVTPLPPQGQPTAQPAPTAQPGQTTTPPLPGQVAPRPYPVPTPSQTSPLPDSAPQQQAPVQTQPSQTAELPYEQTGAPTQPAYQQQPAPAYTAPPPPSYKASDFTTIVDLIGESPSHTRLTQLIAEDNLVGPLEEIGPFTIFAPDNAAFTAMDQAQLVELLKPENQAARDRLLKYHVIKGYLASSELVKQLKRNGGKGSLPTLAGQTLIAGLSPEGKVILTDPEGHVATITAYDLPAFNGLVHVTDVVMIPATPDDGSKKKKKRR